MKSLSKLSYWITVHLLLSWVNGACNYGSYNFEGSCVNCPDGQITKVFDAPNAAACQGKCETILFTKTTAVQNEVALICQRVRGIYFLIFAVDIGPTECAQFVCVCVCVFGYRKNC